MRIIVRSVVSRPSVSDIHPDRMRPPALPNAPTVMANVATVAVIPAFRANGTSWLIVIRPAVVPRQKPTQRQENVGVITISAVVISRADAAAAVGCQFGGR